MEKYLEHTKVFKALGDSKRAMITEKALDEAVSNVAVVLTRRDMRSR